VSKAKKKEKEISVTINFTEGWQERLAKAAYNLYLRLEAQNRTELPHNQARQANSDAEKGIA